MSDPRNSCWSDGLDLTGEVRRLLLADDPVVEALPARGFAMTPKYGSWQASDVLSIEAFFRERLRRGGTTIRIACVPV